MRQLEYLVTGTGRCGTVYMARLLTQLGIPCGHETFFDYHGLSMAKGRLNGSTPFALSEVSTMQFSGQGAQLLPVWLPDINKVVADSSYMAAPFIDDPLFDATTILHVVRNPVKVINSFCHYLGYFSATRTVWEDFIYGNFPELLDVPSQVERATLFYILWNEMIETKSANRSYFRFCIEATEPVFEFLGFEALAKRLPTDINTFEKAGIRKLSLYDIPAGEIRDRLIAVGERYGYSMKSEYVI